MTGIHLLYRHKYLPPSVKELARISIKLKVLINLFATLILPATYHIRRIDGTRHTERASYLFDIYPTDLQIKIMSPDGKTDWTPGVRWIHH
jgi:hypothetical protein